MKKLISLLILLQFFGSCRNSKLKQKEEEVLKKHKTEVFLEEIFIKKFPNYTNNQIVRDNSTLCFKKKMDSLMQLHYMEDLPLRVLKIQKNPHGKGAIVHLYTDNYLNLDDINVLSNKLNFDIIGFMDEKTASTLIEDGKYFIKAKKYKRLNETDISVLVSQVYYSPKAELIQDVVTDDYKFNLGDFLCEIEKIESAE